MIELISLKVIPGPLPLLRRRQHFRDRERVHVSEGESETGTKILDEIVAM